MDTGTPPTMTPIDLTPGEPPTPTPHRFATEGAPPPTPHPMDTATEGTPPFAQVCAIKGTAHPLRTHAQSITAPPDVLLPPV